MSLSFTVEILALFHKYLTFGGRGSLRLRGRLVVIGSNRGRSISRVNVLRLVVPCGVRRFIFVHLYRICSLVAKSCELIKGGIPMIMDCCDAAGRGSDLAVHLPLVVASMDLCLSGKSHKFREEVMVLLVWLHAQLCEQTLGIISTVRVMEDSLKVGKNLVSCLVGLAGFFTESGCCVGHGFSVPSGFEHKPYARTRRCSGQRWPLTCFSSEQASLRT